ncbi:MAG TPA: hypothetical protein VGV67_13855, partial [Solirubrobacteraceae bacterium]|nr:hypothetical protein [Solirubrobacteraceae bacterium]
LKQPPVALACPLVFPSACLDPVQGAATTARVNLRGHFESIEELCFVLRFAGDLLDPGQRGERVGIVYPGTFGFGFAAVDAPIAERELCLGPGDPALEPFLDGRERVTVHMVEGSATLAGVTVRVTGER